MDTPPTEQRETLRAVAVRVPPRKTWRHQAKLGRRREKALETTPEKIAASTPASKRGAAPMSPPGYSLFRVN